ncbi:MAG TPA: hypothetical protein VEY50_04735 [Lysobacter sp.]|nr:hypothetical protein [Lysobacter sp.]
MDEVRGYAVYLFAEALPVLGEAIRPYLQDGPGGPHVFCRELDTGGMLVEMTLDGRAPNGQPVAIELMVPAGMVRMVVSARSDGAFGFGPRVVAPPHAVPAT